MDGKDFARLFKVEGIGQILAFISEDEEANAVLTIRIPNFKGCILKMDIGLPSADFDAQDVFAQNLLDNMTEHGAVKTVQVLLDARDKILGRT